MIRDREVQWNRKFRFYRADFQNYKNTAATDVFVPSDGLAADVLTEIVATDMFAPLMTVAGALDTGSSQIVGPVEIPYDLDIGKNIGVGVVWAHDNTGAASTITFAVTYSFVNFGANIYNSAGGAAASGKLSEPTTALDTVITAQTNFTVANSGEICVSPRGIINANKLVSSSGIWGFRMLVSAGTLSTTKLYFLGILIDYNVHKTVGTGSAAPTGVLQNWLDLSPAPATTAP
jgi:hypothetical protein